MFEEVEQGGCDCPRIIGKLGSNLFKIFVKVFLPVFVVYFLFLPTSFGAFTCVSAADGSIVWTHDFEQGGYGSPILAGDRIYWITADGVTRIFKAADEFELIAQPELGEKSVCTPAMVGKRIYIRGRENLYCIGTE